MAFQVQETACEEERLKNEWGTIENGILSQTTAVDIEVNENINGNLDYSHQVVEFNKVKIDNILHHSDGFLHLGEESECVGKKGEENWLPNGNDFYKFKPSVVDDRGDKNDSVQLTGTNKVFANMKLPSESVKGDDCTIDSDSNVDSKIISNQSIDIQTFKIGDSNDMNHAIPLDEAENTFNTTKLSPNLLNSNQESKSVDDQRDKTDSVLLNKTNIPCSNTKFTSESKDENHTLNSDLNSDLGTILENSMDIQYTKSYKVDDLSKINHTVAVKKNIFENTEHPTELVKANQECTDHTDLNVDHKTIPDCLYLNNSNRNIENVTSKTEDKDSECVNNFKITLSGADCHKMSEEPSERDSCMSSENASLNSIDSEQTTETASINNNLNTDEEISEHNCLLHPTYVMVLNEMNGKDKQISELDETVKRLREVLSEENVKSERISELEQLLSQHEKELILIKREQEIDKQSFNLVKKELENKCAILKKDIEMANRDKENMVMRYAVSEKELIDIKKEKETLIKKLKDTAKENESLLDRMKSLVSDKSKLSQSLDAKTTELSTAHKEIDKLKEEINARDIKIKWTQNKLKTEMETHKEYPSQIDRLMIKVRCLEEDLSNAKTESQNFKKQLEDSEQNKVLESQLKEEQAKLIMKNYEHSEIETKYKSLQTKYQSMIEENNSLSFQVQHLETERLELEKKLSSSREDTEKLSNSVSELQSKLVELDSLNSQLKQSEDKIDTLMNEIERVRHQNEELLQDMSACRARESEMLAFTQKLTTKNVQLQSEFSTLESKAAELEKKDEKSFMELKELKEKLNEVQTELMKEKTKREEETHLLARQIAEKTKKNEAFEVDLADTKANLTQSKVKHATVVKELQRELSLLRRKLESLEASGHVSSASSVSESPYAQACDVSKEILVERILKLQSEAAKSAEKIEFLEDHSAQLLSEVQKQSRLLQSYMLREEAGALAPSFLDSHKAEVSKHGGIMASLYSSTQQDEGMSLELSLEINRKLQAVLEDTLLKNIMLKENLDTLGDEIVRLKEKK